MFYGLPSATTLVLALKKSASLGPKAMYPFSWQATYRQLSALASDLEGISDANDDSESPIKRGSKFLLDTLDEALNARMTITRPLETLTISTPLMPSSVTLTPSNRPDNFDFSNMDEDVFADSMNCLDAADLAALDFTLLGDAGSWGA